MATVRGVSTSARKNALNFIHESTQKRLEEVIPQIQNQGLNALRVDSHNVIYYSKSKGGYTCSCKVIDTELNGNSEEHLNALPSNLSNVSPSISSDREVKIDFNRPLFGERNEVLTSDEENEDIQDFLTIENPDAAGTQGLQSHLFSNNAECGICFRTGYVPGFNIHCHNRIVLTHWELESLESFTLDRTQPHKFTCLDTSGYVEFKVFIPKYWSKVKYSIRNNLDILNYNLEINNLPFTKQNILLFSGKEVTIKVSGLTPDKAFTHLVLDFELKMEQLKANISQISKNLDYTMYDTTGNITVYFPAIHDRCESGDLIYVPEKKILLKVTDVSYSQTANNKHLEWQCTTRVVQPQELLYKIVKDKQLS